MDCSSMDNLVVCWLINGFFAVQAVLAIFVVNTVGTFSPRVTICWLFYIPRGPCCNTALNFPIIINAEVRVSSIKSIHLEMRLLVHHL